MPLFKLPLFSLSLHFLQSSNHCSEFLILQLFPMFFFSPFFIFFRYRSCSISDLSLLVLCLFLGFCFYDPSLYLVFMVNGSEVRVAYPSVSFFFACLRASLGTSCVFLPSLANFVSKGSSLGVVLGSLFLLLSQSIDWFEGLLSERGAMFEVRSSGLSSTDNPVRVEVDTCGLRSFRS